MALVKCTVLLLLVAYVAGLPTYDPVIRKYDELRFQHIEGPDGQLHLVDMWMKASDLAATARYNPDSQNVYHLFTRANPTVSQPLLMGVDSLLGITNFNPQRRTVVLLHGWMQNVNAAMNTILVPAFLTNEDLNIIVVDWATGAAPINYIQAVANTYTSGLSVARFINWLNAATGAVNTNYHLVGHSLGAHKAGIIGRNVGGNVAYITGLEPALPGYISNEEERIASTDAIYVEIIHTNAGVLGYLGTLGDTDFYPNGGVGMPGCNSVDCDHARSYHYFGESLVSGGFTGTRCLTYIAAMTGNCFLWGNLNMGGLVPKTGQSGIFYLETNAAPPFSRG